MGSWNKQHSFLKQQKKSALSKALEYAWEAGKAGEAAQSGLWSGIPKPYEQLVLHKTFQNIPYVGRYREKPRLRQNVKEELPRLNPFWLIMQSGR